MAEQTHLAEYKKEVSRKWRLVLLILFIGTIGTFIPPLVSTWFFGAKEPLEILGGSEFVTLITLIISAYFGANVLQKYVLKDQTDSSSSTQTTTTQVTASTKGPKQKKDVIEEVHVKDNENGEA